VFLSLNILTKNEKQKIFFFHITDLELRYSEMVSCPQSDRKICKKSSNLTPASSVSVKCTNKKYTPPPLWLKKD